MGKRNLILISHPGVNDRVDFERIERYIRQEDPSIRTLVLMDKRELLWRNLYLCARPTLLFSPLRLQHFRMLRGAVFQGRGMSKSEECRRLEAGGFPVPRWILLTPEHVPDLKEFGEYVVMKPDVGGRGADVKIMRRNRVRWRKHTTDFARRSSAWLVQDFVYTGSWPVSYRIATLFGQALWSLRVEAHHGRRPLGERYAFKGGIDGGGMSIVSSGKGCEFRFNNDMEIIRLAEQAHRAFPDIPLLGVDILREQPSGKLHIIEVNAIGFTWHFSSPLGKKIQEQFGFRLESQFDGIRKAARVLAEHVRQHAQ